MERAPRPKILGGVSVKVVTGCGNLYVQLGWHNGKLFEVFATLGKAGGCPTCFSESLTRSITLGLRCGIEVAEYVKQLGGVQCPMPRPFPVEDRVLSCPDAISKVLGSYGLLTAEGMIKLIQELNSQPGQPSSEYSTDEEERQAAIKHMEELKEERERLEA